MLARLALWVLYHLFDLWINIDQILITIGLFRIGYVSADADVDTEHGFMVRVHVVNV